MTGRCCNCHRFTATHEALKRVGAPTRLGFIKEAAEGRQVPEPGLLLCFACLVNSLPANVTK